MASTITIYMPLLDEGVEVWRPVQAESLGENRFRICENTPEDEVWEFGSGEVVRCVRRTFQDGTVGLVPIERL